MALKPWIAMARGFAASVLLAWSVISCGGPGQPPTSTPEFVINSPLEGSTTAGTLFFSVQPADASKVSSVSFKAASKELGSDTTASDGFRVFLSAKDYPAGPLSLTATVKTSNGQTTSKTISVNNLPNPPSSATVGTKGAALGTAEQNGALSTLIVPPGAADGAALSFSARTKAQVKAATGVDYDALGVTFLGAQEITTSKAINGPLGVSSGGFAPMVQPGQAVVNYMIAPDADGDGRGELVVVNTASAAPNGDVISDPVPQIQLGSSVTTSSLGVASVRPLASGISGPPGTLVKIKVQKGSFNPLSAQGNVAIWSASGSNATVQTPGVIFIDPQNPQDQFFLTMIPPLPAGLAKLSLKNESSGVALGALDVTINPSPSLTKPAQTIIREFVSKAIDYANALTNLNPQQTVIVSSLKSALDDLKTQLATIGDDPQLNQKLVSLAQVIQNSGLLNSLKVAQGALAENPYAGLDIAVTCFAVAAAIILLGPEAAFLAIIGKVFFRAGLFFIANWIYGATVQLYSSCQASASSSNFTGMGSAVQPGGNGCGWVAGGGPSSSSLRAQAGLAGGFSVKVFPKVGTAPISPFTGFTDEGGYFFVPFIPQGQPFKAIALKLKTGETRIFEGVGPPTGQSVYMFFDFASGANQTLDATWDAGGDGIHWSDPKNWSNDTLPGEANRAVIDLLGANVLHNVSLGATNVTTILGLQLKAMLSVATSTLKLEGPGVIDGTLNAVGGQTPGVVTGLGKLTVNGTLNLSGGVIANTGELAVNGALQFSEGTIAGAGKRLLVNAAGQMNLSGNSRKAFAGRVIDNFGTLRWSGSGEVYAGGGRDAQNTPFSTFLNNKLGGTFEIQGDATFGACCGDFGPIITNQGTITKSGGTGASILNAYLNNQGGSINVQKGILSIAANGPFELTSTGGTFDVASGAALEFNYSNQPLNWTGTHSGSGAGEVRWNSGNLKIGAAGASLNFSGGGFHWRAAGPGLSGPGTLTNAGLVVLACGDACTIFAGGTFSNAGQLIWKADTGFRLGGVLNNLAGGVIELQGYSQLLRSPTVGTLNNAGIIHKIGGNGVSNWDANLNNSGLLRLSSGSILVGGGGFTQSASGTLETELNPSGLHSIQVTNKATLAGKLKVSLNGVSPNLGDQFEVVTYGSRDGQFATLELPSLGVGKKFDIVYEANRVVIKVIAQ